MIIWKFIHLPQMVRIDENQEAIAHIWMVIDNNNKALAHQMQTDDTEIPREPEFQGLEQHWIFGSPSGRRLDTRDLEKILASDHNYVLFDERLRSFIIHNFPEEAPCYEDLIHVCSFTLKWITISSPQKTGSVI